MWKQLNLFWWSNESLESVSFLDKALYESEKNGDVWEYEELIKQKTLTVLSSLNIELKKEIENISLEIVSKDTLLTKENEKNILRYNNLSSQEKNKINQYIVLWQMPLEDAIKEFDSYESLSNIDNKWKKYLSVDTKLYNTRLFEILNNPELLETSKQRYQKMTNDAKKTFWDICTWMIFSTYPTNIQFEIEKISKNNYISLKKAIKIFKELYFNQK